MEDRSAPKDKEEKGSKETVKAPLALRENKVKVKDLVGGKYCKRYGSA